MYREVKLICFGKILTRCKNPRPESKSSSYNWRKKQEGDYHCGSQYLTHSIEFVELYILVALDETPYDVRERPFNG